MAQRAEASEERPSDPSRAPAPTARPRSGREASGGTPSPSPISLARGGSRLEASLFDARVPQVLRRFVRRRELGLL
ncbi:hypothetical protein, partial [Methylobacterium oryzisoli]